MSEPVPAYTLVDRGDRRVLTVDGRAHETAYSARVLRMLIERKGARRAALYLPVQGDARPPFPEPAVPASRGRGRPRLAVLEVGCSFGHMTEYLDEQPEVADISDVRYRPGVRRDGARQGRGAGP